MRLTWTKTVTSVVDDTTVASYTFPGLGKSDQGIAISSSLSSEPDVIVDCEQNRNMGVANIDVDGFDVVGEGFGEDPPYTLQIVVEI